MRRTIALIALSLITALGFAAPSHAQLEKTKVSIGVGGKPLFYYLR